MFLFCRFGCCCNSVAGNPKQPIPVSILKAQLQQSIPDTITCNFSSPLLSARPCCPVLSSNLFCHRRICPCPVLFLRRITQLPRLCSSRRHQFARRCFFAELPSHLCSFNGRRRCSLLLPSIPCSFRRRLQIPGPLNSPAGNLASLCRTFYAVQLLLLAAPSPAQKCFAK